MFKPADLRVLIKLKVRTRFIPALSYAAARLSSRADVLILPFSLTVGPSGYELLKCSTRTIPA